MEIHSEARPRIGISAAFLGKKFGAMEDTNGTPRESIRLVRNQREPSVVRLRKLKVSILV